MEVFLIKFVFRLVFSPVVVILRQTCTLEAQAEFAFGSMSFLRGVLWKRKRVTTVVLPWQRLFSLGSTCGAARKKRGQKVRWFWRRKVYTESHAKKD